MEDARKSYRILLILSGTFGVFVAADLIGDWKSGGSGVHLVLEGILLAVSAAVFLIGVNRLAGLQKELHSLRGDLEKVRREKDRWIRENHQLLEGLSVKIEQQFAHWNLTKAETEVGFLLLKGLSLKEIADVRRTKLKTVQQQSQTIYQKTGLASRSELAAFFLEDLFPPRTPSGDSP